MPTWNTETLLTIFVALTGLALLAQAIILLAIFVSLRKAVKSLQSEVAELRSSTVSFIGNVRELMDRLTPKFESAIHDMAELAKGFRVLEASTLEVAERVRNQASRVDTMVSGVLDVVDRAGGFVAGAVNAPIRQLSGIMASVKAVVESLRTPSAEPRTNRAAGDKDMFV